MELNLFFAASICESLVWLKGCFVFSLFLEWMLCLMVTGHDAVSSRDPLSGCIPPEPLPSSDEGDHSQPTAPWHGLPLPCCKEGGVSSSWGTRAIRPSVKLQNLVCFLLLADVWTTNSCDWKGKGVSHLDSVYLLDCRSFRGLVPLPRVPGGIWFTLIECNLLIIDHSLDVLKNTWMILSWIVYFYFFLRCLDFATWWTTRIRSTSCWGWNGKSSAGSSLICPTAHLCTSSFCLLPLLTVALR